jgi:hypothetical protein
VCSSPRLLAAYHGLLRTVAPRHPPWTLSRLTIFSLFHGTPWSFPPLNSSAAGCSRLACSGTCSARARVSSFRCHVDRLLRSATVSRGISFVLPSLELSKISGRGSHALLREEGDFIPVFPRLVFSRVNARTSLLWRYGDLNPRPMACKATALATELYPQARFPARERSLLARSIQ